MIWYSSHEQDTLGRLDPKTGEVIEYPYPHSEISMREFFLDSQGRMWYASSVNNKIGYFYFNDDADEAPGNDRGVIRPRPGTPLHSLFTKCRNEASGRP